jgi:hypothetical protein
MAARVAGKIFDFYPGGRWLRGIPRSEACTLGVFRPIAPMCRMRVNRRFHFRFDPTAKNTLAGKRDGMNAVCINKSQF